MSARAAIISFAALLAGLLFAACGGGDGAVTASTAPADAGSRAASPGDGRGGVSLRKLGDFEEPLYVTQPKGSTDLYVVERGGRVRILRDGEVLDRPFLDLSDEVSTSSEQGLLSIAFAPDYPSSRLLYAYYTGTDGDQRVIELRADANGTAVDPGSRREVLRMADFAPNHNGGLLLFGPDGHLYIGTGDGGIADDPQRNGQDLSSLLGKLLRIDPRPSGGAPYGIPAGNPFRSRPGGRPEIYSYGLRNPWRYSFDRDTGALAIGDVGQDSFEEIDYVAAGKGRGANFGWSAYEGDARFNTDQTAPGAIPPVLTYGHDQGCSVTGGYVVRDRGLRSLSGRYLYGDYCSGELRSFVPQPGKAVDDAGLGLTVPTLSSFGEDRAGHIYASSLNGPVFELVAG